MKNILGQLVQDSSLIISSGTGQHVIFPGVFFSYKIENFLVLFFCPGLGDGGALLAMVGGAGWLLLLEAVAATELVPPAGYALGHAHLHTSMSAIYFYYLGFESNHLNHKLTAMKSL